MHSRLGKIRLLERNYFGKQWQMCCMCLRMSEHSDKGIISSTEIGLLPFTCFMPLLKDWTHWAFEHCLAKTAAGLQ